MQPPGAGPGRWLTDEQEKYTHYADLHAVLVCVIMQSPVSGAIDLASEHDLGPAGITRVRVHLNPDDHRFPGIANAGRAWSLHRHDAALPSSIPATS